jgi:hypothetical protein
LYDLFYQGIENLKCNEKQSNFIFLLRFIPQVKNASKDNKFEDDLFNSDDDQHDAYLEQVKAEAAERDSESEDEGRNEPASLKGLLMQTQFTK